MKRYGMMRVVAWACLLLCSTAGIAAGALPIIDMVPGEFRVYDATAKKPIDLSAAKWQEGVYDAQAADLHLHAESRPQTAFVAVTGWIENLRKDERGILLDYRLPLPGPDAAFSNSLEEHIPLAGAEKEQYGAAFPIAAMCTKTSGIAMAIPPSEPRVFDMVGDAKGMATRFYLGLSPLPRRFPNRATFSLIVYPVEPAWGFRSALSKYYGFFAEYYRPRAKRQGLFMFQMGDRLPPNIDQYGSDLVETQLPTLNASIARDVKYGLLPIPYMIVGQREIKFLPAIPSGYDEAMAIFAKWRPSDHVGHPLTKENVCCEGDIHLREEVESSACQTADGKFAVMLRNTQWGANSVTFKTNPNPDLFKDEGRRTVGSDALAVVDRWLKEHPEYAGMFIDSLGANWPALYNYRKDHFTYARYPLTCDAQGRVCLQNVTSHYEYIETLREKMLPAGRLVQANGVYAYKSQTGTKSRARKAHLERQGVNAKMNEFIAQNAPAEHYRPGAKLGRFFCSALLDLATCERGATANVETCQDVRVMLGQKPYGFWNYTWSDGAKVEEFVNRCLAYGIFASNTTTFATGVKYEDHPKGYLRDKKLLDWYVPLLRTIALAGWEPVRYGTLDNKEVSCERFGHGEKVYFTMYNDTAAKAACTLKVDLKSLGLSESEAKFTEIARQTPLARAEASITLQLEPKRAYVIQLERN